MKCGELPDAGVRVSTHLRLTSFRKQTHPERYTDPFVFTQIENQQNQEVPINDSQGINKLKVQPGGQTKDKNCMK